MSDESMEHFIKFIQRIVDIDLCFQCHMHRSEGVGDRGSGFPPEKSQNYTPGVS